MKKMRCVWSALVAILVTAVAVAVHPQVEILKSRILADLGMDELPDMSAVNTSESEMERMIRKYQMRVRRSEEEVKTYHPKGCKKRSHVLFHPELSNDTDLTSARLKFPDSTTLDVSDSVQQWRQSGSRAALAVYCRERHCCRTRLELLVRQPRVKRSTCNQQCCRKSLKISFKDIGWHWVVEPKEFEAFHCVGICKNLLQNFGSRHAIFQAMLTSNRSNVPMPCCSPKRMKPLDVLYYKFGAPPQLVLKTHKDMIVSKCACN